MIDQRRRDIDWSIHTNDDGSSPNADAVLATMMDIRDELKRLNSLLHCRNFLTIPAILQAVKRNTAKKRKPRIVGKPKQGTS